MFKSAASDLELDDWNFFGGLELGNWKLNIIACCFDNLSIAQLFSARGIHRAFTAEADWSYGDCFAC
jgi:hypothetical protein